MSATHLAARLTTNRILNQLWRSPGISRQDLAEILGVDKSTTSKLVANLRTLGIVREDGEGSVGPEGGRKPVALMLEKTYAAVLGIAVQKRSLRWVLRGADGSLLQEGIEPKVDLLLGHVQDIVCRLIDQGHSVRAVGLGVPGIVDGDRGCVLHSTPLKITKETPFPTHLAAGDGILVPLYIENDGRCCAWDVISRRGHGQVDTLCVLGEKNPGIESGNFGIGCSFILKGEVHHGRDYSAGEFASPSTGRVAGEQFPLYDQAAPDTDTKRGLMFRDLARNLAFLFTMLNLGEIVLCGDLSAYHDDLIPLLRNSIRDSWLYENQGSLSIEAAPRALWSVADGAAALIFERLYPANPLGKFCDSRDAVHPLWGLDLVQSLNSGTEEGADR